MAQPTIEGAQTPEQTMTIYESARAEVIQRIGLRDQALISFIITSGAYFGFIAQDRTTLPITPDNIAIESAIVIVLPVLSLVFTYVILQHHVMIGMLGEFLRRLLPASFNHWEKFYFDWPDRRYLSARTVSQSLLLAIPVLYTFAFVYRAIPAALADQTAAAISIAVLAFNSLVLIAMIRVHFWAVSVRRRTA